MTAALPGCASPHNAENRMLWHHHLPHVSLKALQIMLTPTDPLKMTAKCNWDCCVKNMLARKHFSPNTTSLTAESLNLVYSDIHSPLEIAIGAWEYMLVFINDATSHTDESRLKYKSEALEKLKQLTALREQESGKPVK
jgi:hypothetical protein